MTDAQDAARCLIKHRKPRQGDLSVWWIPQVPGKPFRCPVKTPQEGKLLLDCLAQYDLFQLAHHIKPDFSNAGGLTIWNAGDWEGWEDEDGNDIDSTTTFQTCQPT